MDSFFLKKVYESCFHAGLGFYIFPNNVCANLMQTLILLSEIPPHYSAFSGKICCCIPFHLVFLNISLQDLLKKLYALRSAANKKPSTVEGVKQTAEKNLSTSTNDSAPSLHEDAPSTAPLHDSLKKVQVKSTQSSTQHFTNQFDPLFWWFHSVRLKFGKIHIVLPSGKLMLLFSLLFSTIYVLRRKTAGLKR
jgi:hypothetical protein